jgi:hypothetical protein
MTDRERLGLPAFVETPLQAEVTQATTELRQQPAGALLALIEDGAVDLARRIAAGNLLALAGDPRIDPLAPEMIDIPGGDVTIGLDADEVDAVLARHERLGLSRSWIEKEVPPAASRALPVGALSGHQCRLSPVPAGERRRGDPHQLGLPALSGGKSQSSGPYRHGPRGAGLLRLARRTHRPRHAPAHRVGICRRRAAGPRVPLG